MIGETESHFQEALKSVWDYKKGWNGMVTTKTKWNLMAN